MQHKAGNPTRATPPFEEIVLQSSHIATEAICWLGRLQIAPQMECRRSGGLPVRRRSARTVGVQDFRFDVRDEIVDARKVAVVATATDVDSDSGISKEPGKRVEKGG